MILIGFHMIDPSKTPRLGWRLCFCAWALVLGGICGAAPSGRAAGVGPPPSSGPLPQEMTAEEAAELELLLAEERREAERLLSRGEVRAAEGILLELLEDDPSDAMARLLLARGRRGRVPSDDVLGELRRALEDATDPAVRVRAARTLAEMLVELGQPQAALETIGDAQFGLDPSREPEDAWLLAEARAELGDAAGARAARRTGCGLDVGSDWRRGLFRGRCERVQGLLEPASRTLTRALAQSKREGNEQALLQVELARVFFEADGEIQYEGIGEDRYPGARYKRALVLSPELEPALLGLFQLGRFNWKRTSKSAGEYLNQALAAYPHSVEAHLAAASAALNDGHLPRVRRHLKELDRIAPMRRAVRAEKAALAWVEHRRDDARSLLAELAESDPSDGLPEREVGRHLIELYRFAEARPFLESSVERDANDPEAWTLFGRALANSGDEKRGLEALEKAVELARGRRNAWRENMLTVLRKLDGKYGTQEAHEHTFVWEDNAASVLATYTVPFYAEARAELAERYGFTPGDVRIEFFGKHADFSVRSTGYQGFPALGVCFGPVVTAVSPLAELRGTFSWARTAFHEYTHVIHLGLSNNRCPRWITEGLATWEEERKNRAWGRNMRQDLIDARANGQLIPVRELNAAFRGSRILFGYYEGGLLCSMLIEEFGFSPMIRLLEAFDAGLDLDQAFDKVFQLTPEDVDRRLERHVDAMLAELSMEPRWSPDVVAALRFRLRSQPPEDAAERQRWAEDWSTVAWGAWQARRRIDAEEGLRKLQVADALTPRAHFLRGRMALARGDKSAAVDAWTTGFENGGEGFGARMALGTLLLGRGELEEAERQLRAAERAFPGYPEVGLAAELVLASLLETDGRIDEAMQARERWLGFNSGEQEMRLAVARWHAESGRHEQAAAGFAGANDVDPFHSGLHREWADALEALDRPDEADRELRVALMVPAEVDGDPNGPLDDRARAQLHARLARLHQSAGRADDARVAAETALGLDPDNELARSTLEGLP